MKIKTYSLIQPFHTVVRWVEVPDELLGKGLVSDFDLIFRYGQNEVQPQNIPSLSVGDLIVYKNNVWLIDSAGITNVITGETV